MSNTYVAKKEVFSQNDTICPDCENKIEYVVSETNSKYSFCNECGYNLNITKKHIEFDKIFKSFQEYLKLINNTKNELSVSVNVSRELLTVYVNDDMIYKSELLFKINNKDISILKHTIKDLIDDNFEEGTIKSIVKIFL